MPSECPPSDGSAPKTQRFSGPPPMCIDLSKRYTAEMVTSKGTMVFALDAVTAPRTVNNFVFLARYHYFEGISFHRIIPGFVLQGGDPDGTGMGGPGYRFEDELPHPGATSSARSPWPTPGLTRTGASSSSSQGRTGCACPRSTHFSGRSSRAGVVAAIDALGTKSGGPRRRCSSSRSRSASSTDRQPRLTVSLDCPSDRPAD